MKEKYINAIAAVNYCVLNDNRETWWPKIIRKETDFRTYYDIDGIEVGSCSYKENNAFDDALSSSLLRIIKKNVPCALFAYPIEFRIRPIDIIVGFMKEDKELVLAWNNKSVYPLIGNQWYSQTIPKDTKWIIGASMDTDYRRAISRFAHDHFNLSELKKYTPYI